MKKHRNNRRNICHCRTRSMTKRPSADLAGVLFDVIIRVFTGREQDGGWFGEDKISNIYYQILPNFEKDTHFSTTVFVFSVQLPTSRWFIPCVWSDECEPLARCIHGDNQFCVVCIHLLCWSWLRLWNRLLNFLILILITYVNNVHFICSLQRDENGVWTAELPRNHGNILWRAAGL